MRLVSTTIQSWPHSSPVAGPGGITRLYVSTTIQSWPHSSTPTRVRVTWPSTVSTTIQSWPHSSAIRRSARQRGSSSPRLSSRGPIQAWNDTTRAALEQMRSPRLSSRGPIQAPDDHVPMWTADRCLHDYPVVAPFKHLPVAQQRLPDRVSTTIQSWPHSSGAISAVAASLSSSPRLSSRGPIQAFARLMSCWLACSSPRLSSRGPIQAPPLRPSRRSSSCLHDYPVVAPFKRAVRR